MPLTETLAVSEKETFLADLMGVLTSCEPTGNYKPDRAKQETVLTTMLNQLEAEMPGGNLIELMWGHIQAHAAENKIYREKTGKQGEKQGSDRGLIAGKLFELLVECDEDLCHRSAISAELLGIAHAPGRYGFGEQLHYMRNPDAADFKITKSGMIVITEIGEAKAGKLNNRLIKQLDSRTGFIESLNELAGFFSKNVDLQGHGLPQLAAAKAAYQKIHGKSWFLAVDSNVKQIVFVPADRDTEDLRNILYDDDFPTEDDKEWGAEVLEKCATIKKAAFSSQELAALTKHISDQISLMPAK